MFVINICYWWRFFHLIINFDDCISQASNFDELMAGEPGTSLHSTSMIGLIFLAHLSSKLIHQDCSIRPQSSSSITPNNTIIGKASISLLCLILVAWMQLTSVAMSILPELLWLVFSCGLLRPCGYYNKATLFRCRSFAPFTYHDLLRPRCYSNEVTPVSIITTSSMAYSEVDASEHLLIVFLSLITSDNKSEKPSISTYHRHSDWNSSVFLCRSIADF